MFVRGSESFVSLPILHPRINVRRFILILGNRAVLNKADKEAGFQLYLESCLINLTIESHYIESATFAGF